MASLLGGVDFSNLAIQLSDAGPDGEPVLLRYGAFIQSVVDFVIIAFAIFMMIRFMNNLTKKEEEPEAPAEPSDEVKLLTEIRDQLAK